MRGNLNGFLEISEFICQKEFLLSLNTRLVEFADREGMRYALDKLDGEELDGRKLRLAEEKRGGRSMRSRSRTPPPRRSKSRYTLQAVKLTTSFLRKR